VSHESTTGIRERYQHIFRDNGDATLAFGIETVDGHFQWVEAPGSFPSGPVRVVIAFNSYIGVNNGNGPGFNGNLSPSKGGFTWHWDELTAVAHDATPSIEYFGGNNANRIVTASNCIAFSQGLRLSTHHRNISPCFHCLGDAGLSF